MTWVGLNPPYATLVVDPPWPVKWDGVAGGAHRNTTRRRYSTMPLDAICALPITDLAAPDAHLFLWVPARLFREGIGVQVARAWGFQPGTEIIWEKAELGMGAMPRICHEYLLPARRGNARWSGPRNLRSVQRWPHVYGPANGQAGMIHSAKPPAAYDLVERVSPGPYVELFARQPRLNWDSWGHGYEHLGTAEVGR